MVSDTKKSLPQFLFLQLKVTMKYLKKKEIQQNCLALMIITIYICYIIISPLDTSTFSLKIIIKHLF